MSLLFLRLIYIYTLRVLVSLSLSHRSLSRRGDSGYGGDASRVDLTNIAAISCGQLACVARKTDGTALAWGDREYGGDATHKLEVICPDEIDGCAQNDCCISNRACDDIDGTGTDYSSCVAGNNHLKDVLTGICTTGTCTVSDCCDVNPTCDNIDGNGADFVSSSCIAGTNHLKDTLTGVACTTGICSALDCCDANPTCNNIDGNSKSFASCVDSTNHLKDDLSNTCATDICAVSDCCDANPTCDNIDGTGNSFASCVDSTNHLKDDLSNTCASDICAVSDCCDANPTCDNIDGTGKTFSSCVAGTNHLKDTLTDVTCTTGTCVTSDCCNAVAEKTSVPSPSSTRETTEVIVGIKWFLPYVVFAVLVICCCSVYVCIQNKRREMQKRAAMSPAVALEGNGEEGQKEQDKEEKTAPRTFTQLLAIIQGEGREETSHRVHWPKERVKKKKKKKKGNIDIELGQDLSAVMSALSVGDRVRLHAVSGMKGTIKDVVGRKITVELDWGLANNAKAMAFVQKCDLLYLP